MKTLLIGSNNGNHHGFNRKWEILEEFNNEDDAKKACANLHNEYYDLWEEGDENEDFSRVEFETSIGGFNYDGMYFYVITQDDYDRGIFDGGHYGYASREIADFFEEEN